MATTGFLLPTARTVDTGSGTWTNDVNVLADDGAEATFSLTSKNTTGRWLIGQSFGFDSAIPAGATIDQVNIRMEYRVNSTGGIANPELQAFVSGGAVGATRAGSPAEPTTLTENTFDITADRSWVRADLLDGTFDLRCRGRNGNSTNDPSYRWDYLAVEVVYTAGGATVEGVAEAAFVFTGAAAGIVPGEPVREFDGTDDEVITATGGLSAMTHGTVAALFKARDFSANQSIFRPHNSGGSHLGQMLGVSSPAGAVQWSATGGGSVAQVISSGVWYLVVMRKATGTVTPRFSVYNYNTSAWSHQDGSITRPDLTAPGASGTIKMSFQSTSEFFDGWMAVRAAWANALPWSADTTGDTAIEGAGLEDALQAWVDESPSALWPFNQTVTTDPVDDIIGAADQTSLTGTTAVLGDAPPGFDFTVGGGVTVEGVATGAFVFTGAASGIPRTSGAAAASFTFTGTAAGVDRAVGQAAGALAFTGSASGQVGAAPVEGQASAAFTFVGAAVGVDRAIGTASAAFTFTGTAAGQPFVSGQATAAVTFTGTAAGVPEVFGQAAASLAFTGTANGFAGTPPVTGQATAAFAFTGSAAGLDRALGVATAPFTFTTTAAGRPRVVGAAIAPLTFTAAAAGVPEVFGQAAAALAFTGTAAGVIGLVPVQGHALAALAFTAAGRGLITGPANPGSAAMGITPNGRGTVALVAVASGTVGVDTAATATIG